MGSVVPHYKELHQAAGANKPGDNQEAKTMQAARDRDDDFF